MYISGQRKISRDLKTKRLFEHAVDFIRLRVRLSLIPVAQTGQAIILDKNPMGFTSSNMSGKEIVYGGRKIMGKFWKVWENPT